MRQWTTGKVEGLCDKARRKPDEMPAIAHIISRKIRLTLRHTKKHKS